jgi:hypothetical protein
VYDNYCLVHKLIIHKELEEIVGGVADLRNVMQWLLLEIKHIHAKDVGLCALPPPVLILCPVMTKSTY